MSVTDPIADALTKIRNAYNAGHMQVKVNHSNLVEAVVKILSDENFVSGYEVIERDKVKKIARKLINVNLRYTNAGQSLIRGIERVSRPGLRRYVNAAQIPSVFNNTGVAIISTSRGVMVGLEARKQGVGGEYICKVW